MSESTFDTAARQLGARFASSGADTDGSPSCTVPAISVAPEGADSPPFPATTPVEVPVTAPAMPTPGRPGAARNGSGSLRRIQPHWRYTWNGAGQFNYGDVLCGACVWILLYRRFRTASLLPLSVGSGFVRCTQCGRLEA